VQLPDPVMACQDVRICGQAAPLSAELAPLLFSSTLLGVVFFFVVFSFSRKYGLVGQSIPFMYDRWKYKLTSE